MILMKLIQITVLVLIATAPSNSQTVVEGTYRLQGVHDMVAAFHFKPDGHFAFEYFYGAVDRFATGTYSVSGDTIILKSDKEAGKDFTITFEEKRKSGFSIVVNDKNKYLTDRIRCIFMKHDEIMFEHETDNTGRLLIDTTGFDQVYLQHPYFPDVATLLRNSDNTNNYFEVKLNSSLQQVSFKGVHLFIKDGYLTCHQNYLIPVERIRFIKE